MKKNTVQRIEVYANEVVDSMFKNIDTWLMSYVTHYIIEVKKDVTIIKGMNEYGVAVVQVHTYKKII